MNKQICVEICTSTSSPGTTASNDTPSGGGILKQTYSQPPADPGD